MSDPLAIEPTLGGLLGDLPAVGSKPRAGAMKPSPLLSEPSGSRTPHRLARLPELGVAPVASGSR
jgi:hypothetical protein